MQDETAADAADADNDAAQTPHYVPFSLLASLSTSSAAAAVAVLMGFCINDIPAPSSLFIYVPQIGSRFRTKHAGTFIASTPAGTQADRWTKIVLPRRTFRLTDRQIQRHRSCIRTDFHTDII